MVPPAPMVAIKNRGVCSLLFVVVLAVLFAGCGPPGPRALWDGKRLLDRGQYARAVDKLKTATTLLSTNANAWNYLGLAYHRAGQPTNAAIAYQRALSLNRDLLEARFNLGCLWLEHDNPEAARAEFTAYTLRRPNAPEGWVKLGYTQLRLRDIAGAEKSFSEALHRNAKNPDAFNGLGLAQLQRNRPREAARYFAGALQQQQDHRPALLNLARVLDGYLNDRPGALNRYHQYLALKPRPADWDAVHASVQALEQQLHQSAPQQQRPEPKVTAPVPTNAPAVNTQTVAARQPAVSRPEPARPGPITVPHATPVEIVALPPEPVIKTSPNVAPPRPVGHTPAVSEPEPSARSVTVQPEERSVFRKLNPMNLFRREPTVRTNTTSLSSRPSEPDTQPASNAAVTGLAAAPRSPASARPPSFGRYHYVSPRSPKPGNSVVAERQFAQGIQLRAAGRLSDAVQLFRQAVKSDPANWGAQFNLALAEYESGRFKKSLPVWETVLAIRAASTDARYNFSLALKAAGYPLDAANELEKILATNPDEIRAHLALANVCADQLQDTARARVHYLKVLELSPDHRQASAIRYWLVSNPQ